jgi:hypothetical protein
MRRAVVGLGGLLIVFGVAVGAMGAVSRATMRNRAEARVDAKRQLASVLLPSGAREVGGDPSVHRTLGGCDLACNFFLDDTALVDEYRFWRVPEAPKELESWVRAHPPTGGRFRSSGEWPTGLRKPPYLYVLFGFPPESGHVFGRSLEVKIANAKGGGSAVRVDGAAIWRVTRPRWDKIPHSVRVLTARVEYGDALSRPVTLSPTRQRAVILSVINSARVRQPAPLPSCPFQLGSSVSLAFRAQRAGPVLARVGASFSCPPYMSLTVGGRSGPVFDTPFSLWNVLIKYGAVAPCAGSALALESSGVQGSGEQPFASLRMVDKSRHACEIREATVQLFGPDHRPLPVPVFYRGSITRLLLAPQVPLGIRVTPRRTCTDRQVARIQLSIMGLRRSLSAPIHKHRRFTPCQATVEFTPLLY